MSAQDKGREADIKARESADKAKESARLAKDAAEERLEQGKEKAEEVYQEGKEKAVELKNEFVQKLREDGVKNPQGLFMVGFGPVFVAAVPLVSFISGSPVLTRVVDGAVSALGFVATAGKSSTVAQASKVVALAAGYTISTYAFGGAFSAAAIDAGNEEGRNNEVPRKQVSNLTGLPLRLHSLAAQTIENFPAFALAAALTQAIAPRDTELINLLGLHVLTKIFVYGPAYIANVGPLRTVAHIIATSSVVAVGLKLVNRPLL
ncbi:hypothetical protein AMS68_006264 [Peltaster fructicola]|uniref:Uncharacterized protein n=1 Tax=Peltaster fructicola TaxID=286661 RepID=A0A6H0Y159_9PEZI|nr:hypothetical protein AMS68_006264 [Peltaster fructicola]